MPHDGAWHAVRRARPKGAKVHSPGQAKRRPGYNVLCSLRPACKGKSTETERVMFTFALAGRGVIECDGLPRVSLRLPWAMEAIGLSARFGLTGLCATIVFSARLG